MRQEEEAQRSSGRPGDGMASGPRQDYSGDPWAENARQQWHGAPSPGAVANMKARSKRREELKEMKVVEAGIWSRSHRRAANPDKYFKWRDAKDAEDPAKKPEKKFGLRRKRDFKDIIAEKEERWASQDAKDDARPKPVNEMSADEVIEAEFANEGARQKLIQKFEKEAEALSDNGPLPDWVKTKDDDVPWFKAPDTSYDEEWEEYDVNGRRAIAQRDSMMEATNFQPPAFQAPTIGPDDGGWSPERYARAPSPGRPSQPPPGRRSPPRRKESFGPPRARGDPRREADERRREAIRRAEEVRAKKRAAARDQDALGR